MRVFTDRRVLAIGSQLFVAVGVTFVCAADKQPAMVKNPALRDELLRRMKEDQDARVLILKSFANRKDAELKEVDWEAFAKEIEPDPKAAAQIAAAFRKQPKMKMSDAILATLKEETKTDRANTARMKEIVDQLGWPGRSLVGGQAEHAAWLLVQHADLDPRFQRRCLSLLEQAVKDGQAEAKDFAYLTDRVLIAEGKKQAYGTQYEASKGQIKPKPIEDEARVDERRKKIGLEPLANYLKTAQEFYRSSAGSVP
jgi:hypothetical protein